MAVLLPVQNSVLFFYICHSLRDDTSCVKDAKFEIQILRSVIPVVCIRTTVDQ